MVTVAKSVAPSDARTTSPVKSNINVCHRLPAVETNDGATDGNASANGFAFDPAAAGVTVLPAAVDDGSGDGGGNGPDFKMTSLPLPPKINDHVFDVTLHTKQYPGIGFGTPFGALPGADVTLPHNLVYTPLNIVVGRHQRMTKQKTQQNPELLVST